MPKATRTPSAAHTPGESKPTTEEISTEGSFVAANSNARGRWVARLVVAAIVVVAGVSFLTRRPARAVPQARSAVIGPWGAMERMSFFLEQPARYLAASSCVTGPTRWVLPGHTEASVRTLLTNTGLDPAQTEAMLRATRCDSSGCAIVPSRDAVLGLTPSTRASLYAQLGRFPVNVPQAFPFTRPADDRRWDALAGVLDPRAIDRLTWRRGDQVHLSDLEPLCELATTEAARTTLLETLSRMSAVMAWLVVTPDTDITALVDYWALRGSSRNLTPILGALARQPGGARLDVINVLPRFARRRLNTFPYPDDPPRDCYWSALNFFAVDEPPDVFVDGHGALATLERDYVTVGFEARRFGDVILFVEPGRGPVHAVNQIADDLVFTKNGGHFRRPWTMMPLSEVRESYPDAGELRVYRRRVPTLPVS